jgi:hypothetical protein
MTKNRILWFGFHEFHRGYLWYHKITISGIAWWPPDYPYLALWSHYYPIYPLVSSGYLTVRHGKWPSYRWFTYQKWWLALTNLLVGGIPTPLKNMSSADWIIIPTIVENKKCSKPPTSISLFSSDSGEFSVLCPRSYHHKPGQSCHDRSHSAI